MALGRPRLLSVIADLQRARQARAAALGDDDAGRASRLAARHAQQELATAHAQVAGRAVDAQCRLVSLASDVPNLRFAGHLHRPAATRVEAIPGFSGKRVAVDKCQLDDCVFAAEQIAAGDHDVGDMARLQRTQPRLFAEQTRGHGGQRRQGLVCRQPALDRHAQARPEILARIGQAVRADGVGHAGAVQQRQVGRRLLPMLQRLQRHIHGAVRVLDLGRGQVGQRHDHRQRRRLQLRRAPVLKAVALGDDAQFELVAQTGDIRVILLIASREDHQLLAGHHRGERFQRGVGLDPLAAFFRCRCHRAAVPAGIVQRLAQQGHCTHQRRRVGAVAGLVDCAGQMLGHARRDHQRLAVAQVAQLGRGDQRTLAAKNTVGRTGQQRGETQLAHRLDLVLLEFELRRQILLGAYGVVTRGQHTAIQAARRVGRR